MDSAIGSLGSMDIDGRTMDINPLAFLNIGINATFQTFATIPRPDDIKNPADQLSLAAFGCQAFDTFYAFRYLAWLEPLYGPSDGTQVLLLAGLLPSLGVQC